MGSHGRYLDSSLLVKIKEYKNINKTGLTNLASKVSRGYQARKPRGNLFRGRRQEDVCKILEVLRQRGESHRIYGDAENGRSDSSTSTAWGPLIFEDNFVSIAEEVANGCADALVCRVGELAEIV